MHLKSWYFQVLVVGICECVILAYHVAEMRVCSLNAISAIKKQKRSKIQENKKQKTNLKNWIPKGTNCEPGSMQGAFLSAHIILTKSS